MIRKDTRKLTIDNINWEYKIGKKCVAIYNPDGNRYFPRIEEIVGKKSFERKNYALNPGILVYYIQKEILKVSPTIFKCQYCGNPHSSVVLRNNPFQAEIYEDYSNHLICNSCYENLCDEI
jgi:hypothetical protein